MGKVRIPDRTPSDTEPATSKQIAYLGHLGDFKESDLSKLGKWQASDLIDLIIQEGKGGSDLRSKVSRGKGCFRVILILALALGGIYILAIVAGGIYRIAVGHSDANPSLQKSIPKPPIHPITTSLESLTLPISVVAIEQINLLNGDNKEVSIPVGSEIKIVKRNEYGVITAEFNGAVLIGLESRLTGKIGRY